MNDQKDECFETETGVPTLTIEVTGTATMIPYSSFRQAVFQEDQIEIECYDWQIEIEGQRLSSLWRQLQMQDVRVIRRSSGAADGPCLISEIKMTQIQEDSEGQAVSPD